MSEASRSGVATWKGYAPSHLNQRQKGWTEGVGHMEASGLTWLPSAVCGWPARSCVLCPQTRGRYVSEASLPGAAYTQVLLVNLGQQFSSETRRALGNMTAAFVEPWGAWDHLHSTGDGVTGLFDPASAIVTLMTKQPVVWPGPVQCDHILLAWLMAALQVAWTSEIN